jgi:hypothetical protein
MNPTNPLRTTPRRAVVIFLLAVFFTFVAMGLANDIVSMGRQAPVRFGWSLLISGSFAVCYAVSGITLRSRIWKAFIPLFVVHMGLLSFLGRRYPDAPHLRQMNVSETDRLEKRLSFDGLATIITVCLGYVGFVHVFVSEGKRHIRAQAEKAQLEAEMAAAREVQHVMLPDEAESFPGYAVDFVYRPALQVGGDFFQILPVGNNGFLIVVGDVAGKGLSAAMHVSMLIGAIRTLAVDTSDPAVVLQKLHDRLIGRSSGISTALAARVSRDGAVTIANAGHLSPYLDGREVELPGALPLGIAEGGDYASTRLELRPGSRLTFYSDGVVEAQSKSGELFGFERAREISTESAESIVEKAVQFGQSDDITVVTIDRLATSEASAIVGTTAALDRV